MNEALSLLQAAQYWLTDDGIDNWIINNVRVSQTSDGLVRLSIIMLRILPSKIHKDTVKVINDGL